VDPGSEESDIKELFGVSVVVVLDGETAPLSRKTFIT
jgi:hypothetical protein